MSTASNGEYYVPHGTHWPMVGSIGLALTVIGIANFMHGTWSMTPMFVGLAILIFMMYGWFGQVDMSFRLSMGWFIFSEVMFFAAFFGALFYARMFSIPWLDGASNNAATAEFLWPDFEAAWPLLTLPLAEKFSVARDYIGPWGLPAINTVILLTSGLTVTFAHWALKRGDRT